MKISIGIPFYNAERFLSLAISSVLHQSYSDFELILSDDGSTDNSLEIARSFSDPRIRIISDCHNLGIAFRLNEQIRLAQGQYFARMDADDIMDHERIEIQVGYLENNPMVDVIGSSAVVIDENNCIIGHRTSNVNNKIEQAFRSVCFIHPTVTGKTSWFRTNGYLNELKGVEDFDLWIRTFNHSTFINLDRPLLFYRDPPQLKIKTYKFRQKQVRKALLANRRLLIKKPYLLGYLMFQTYIKTFIMILAKKVNYDKHLVRRRNELLENNSRDIFQQRLNLLINR